MFSQTVRFGGPFVFIGESPRPVETADVDQRSERFQARFEWPVIVAALLTIPPFAPAAWQAGRAFRLFQLLRLVRVFSVRRLLSLEGIKYAALTAAGTVALGGAVVASLEKEQHWTTWDGVWWAATTVTTVGYGDLKVETDGGRIIAMAIMLVGIGFVALLTAFIADRFVQGQREVGAKEDLILTELQEIRLRLENLESTGSDLR